MGKELESRVEELVRLEDIKKDAGRRQYQAQKAYDKVYDDVLAKLKSNHTMPEGSAYFARLVLAQAGRINHKWAFEQFAATHPQYANTLNSMLEQSKLVESEKLEYGRMPELPPTTLA